MLCPRPHANIRFHDRLLTPIGIAIRSLASLAPPFRRAISVLPTAPRTRQTASASATTTTTIASASSAALEVGDTLRTRWSVRPSNTPVCESRPHSRSLAARSAVQRLPLPPLPRPSHPQQVQQRPPSPSQEPGALRSARPCARARQARRAGKWRMARLLLERSRCSFRARLDRASGGMLEGCREGSVQPSGGGAGPRSRPLDVIFVNT